MICLSQNQGSGLIPGPKCWFSPVLILKKASVFDRQRICTLNVLNRIMAMGDPVAALLFTVLASFSALQLAACSTITTPKPKDSPSECRLPSISSKYLSVGFGFDTEDLSCVSSTGTMKTFTIFVDFADQPAVNDTTQALYDFFFPNASIWYETSSYGKLSLDSAADTSQFYRMPLNASEYAWNRGITYEQHEAYIQDALEAYTVANGADVPPVDALYVVAGRNSPAITYSPTFMGNVTTRNGTFVSKKAVTVGYDAYAKWGYKLINHETGHVMCLADLYPATGAVGLYVGDYNIMGNINALYPDYFAWDKWRLGWLEDAQVDCISAGKKGVTTHTVHALESKSQEIKFVVLKRNETQALVVEARTGGGVDNKGGKAGVVVYAIDTTVETLQGPIRVFTEKPLSLDNQTELEVPGWSAKVTLIEQQSDAYVVSIETGSSNVTETRSAF